MEDLIKLNVLGITYSQIQSGAYALVLSESDGDRRIPIIIGTAEAQSIAVELEHIKPPRPLTHDLLAKVLESFDITLKKICIYKFENGVFSSELTLAGKEGVEKSIDSRTSDAVSIAIRTGSDSASCKTRYLPFHTNTVLTIHCFLKCCLSQCRKWNN